MRMFDFTPPIDLHKELNPKLWSNGHLLPKVHEALLKISQVYYKFLQTDAPLLDVVVSGSQSNYNYTDHSDLDLHLIIPYEHVNCNGLDPVEFFDTKRKLWKEQHNITIHGIPVELYAEDVALPAISAVYSLMDKEWVKEPPPPVIQYDVEQVKAEAEKWAKIIDGAVRARNFDMLTHVRDMLSRYRKDGLAKNGELGTENLAFKSLRNGGKIKLLMGMIRHLEDKEMSV